MAVGLDEDRIKEYRPALDPADRLSRSIVERKPFIVPDAAHDRGVTDSEEKFNSTPGVIPCGKREGHGGHRPDHAEPGRHVPREALNRWMTFASRRASPSRSSMYQELKLFSQQMEEKIQKTSADLRKTEAQLIRSEKLAARGQLARDRP